MYDHFTVASKSPSSPRLASDVGSHVARSKQVYINRMEATVLYLSHLEVTSDFKYTMPVQAGASREHARRRCLRTYPGTCRQPKINCEKVAYAQHVRRRRRRRRPIRHAHHIDAKRSMTGCS